jgi:hypothetical protein
VVINSGERKRTVHIELQGTGTHRFTVTRTSEPVSGDENDRKLAPVTFEKGKAVYVSPAKSATTFIGVR